MSLRRPIPLLLTGLLAAAFALFAPAAAPAGGKDVQPPLVAGPPDPVGTVLLVHGGGWSGPDPDKQEKLLEFPGQVFVDRRWRTVSVDYAAGLDGLQSVKDAIGAELVDPARTGPLCVYGESAGAHLAMIAAAQMPSVDCVMALGVPTDFSTYKEQAQAEGNETAAGTYDETIVANLGDPAGLPAGWQPVAVASEINADVLAIRQADDQIVPKGQLDQLVDALPVLDTLVTVAGDLTSSSQQYLHGTLPEQARTQLAGAVGSFVDRAVAQAPVEAWGRAQHCADANGALGRIGFAAFRKSVACLVNRVRQEGGVDERVRSAVKVRGGRRATARVVGQVTPARVVSSLARSRATRAALLRPARTVAASVHAAEKSAVSISLR